MSDETMQRANWIGAPQFFILNQACRPIVDAFGWHLYLVGSALTKRDYRDVDLRLILPDEDFDRLFPGIHPVHRACAWLDARWSVLCVSISEWLTARTGLPIDFQIQRSTEANAEFRGPRNAVGIFVEPQRATAPTEERKAAMAPNAMTSPAGLGLIPGADVGSPQGELSAPSDWVTIHSRAAPGPRSAAPRDSESPTKPTPGISRTRAPPPRRSGRTSFSKAVARSDRASARLVRGMRGPRLPR